MKLGRFIVDTHVHSQRHAAGKALQGSKDYSTLGTVMSMMDAYDNSARLLYDMERYGVDICVTEVAFGMTTEINLEQKHKYPDKFVCNAWPRHYQMQVKRGEIEWTIEGFCRALEDMLKTGEFVGVGEAIPIHLHKRNGRFTGEFPEEDHVEYVDEHTIISDMMQVLDLCRKYKVPFRYHTGLPGGYAISYHASPATYNPLWAHTLAVAYPDVPIVLEHAGIEGGWWEHIYDACLHVAAGHKNIYLECGRFWTELYYRALTDPSVGCEKLLWGTDWGASLPVYSNIGRYPAGYTRQNVKAGIIGYQHDIWGWSLRQLAKLDISQDDMNLILGGNAVRLYNLRTPGGLTRMFKFVE
jgi:predicted TIM-barrel fold metal-dependent hydrolase